jgi:PhoPQ-activated pathogenicity-related protein
MTRKYRTFHNIFWFWKLFFPFKIVILENVSIGSLQNEEIYKHTFKSLSMNDVDKLVSPQAWVDELTVFIPIF